MNILAAHFNTSRATEMSFTKMELADIGHQNVVHHIILSSLVLLQVLCGLNIVMSIPAADKVSLSHLAKVGGFTDLYSLMSEIKRLKS